MPPFITLPSDSSFGCSQSSYGSSSGLTEDAPYSNDMLMEVTTVSRYEKVNQLSGLDGATDTPPAITEDTRERSRSTSPRFLEGMYQELQSPGAAITPDSPRNIECTPATPRQSHHFDRNNGLSGGTPGSSNTSKQNSNYTPGSSFDGIHHPAPQADDGDTSSSPSSQSTVQPNCIAKSLGIKSEPTYNPRAYQASLQQSKTFKSSAPDWFINPYVNPGAPNKGRFKTQGISYSSREEYRLINRLDKPEVDPRTIRPREGSISSLGTQEGYDSPGSGYRRGSNCKRGRVPVLAEGYSSAMVNTREVYSRNWLEGITEFSKCESGLPQWESQLPELETQPPELETQLPELETQLPEWEKQHPCDSEQPRGCDNFDMRCSWKLGNAIAEMRTGVKIRNKTARVIKMDIEP